MSEEPQEMFCALYLNAQNEPVGIGTIQIGSNVAVSLSPAEVFKRALLCNAPRVILAHNHPSGCVQPSKKDMELTINIGKLGMLMGVQLTDHIVIGGGNYISLVELLKQEKENPEIEREYLAEPLIDEIPY